MTIMRRITFNAGHRLLGHEGMCKFFHGHNYAAEFYVRPSDSETLDDVGRVIDFSQLKARLKGWIDEHWDHGFLLHSDDTNAIEALQQVEPSRLYLLPDNPTAETMASYLLNDVCPKVLSDLGVECFKVVMWETSESCAIAELPVRYTPEPLLAEETERWA